ncbi:MAG: hypothetical protein KA765_16240 [Thermoflexales bacterium]|nr:hypothetical protein [Thermoflexales bacterium]
MSDLPPIILSSDSGPSQPMIYRYPAAYRVQALFGALLFGLIVIGSVIAEVEAIRTGRLDAVLHVFGFVSGSLVLLLGLDIGTRMITTTPHGLQTKWLRTSSVAWSEVIGWRYLPLSLIHIRLRHGPGWFVWPILERYSDLLATIDDRLTR